MKKAMITTILLLGSMPAFAEEAAIATTSEGSGLLAIAAAISIALVGFAGALAQGKIGAAAMEGISRNPQAAKAMFVPMILGLVLIESLVIYALVIAFQLITKL